MLNAFLLPPLLMNRIMTGIMSAFALLLRGTTLGG